jgi:PKD repeat protein
MAWFATWLIAAAVWLPLSTASAGTVEISPTNVGNNYAGCVSNRSTTAFCIEGGTGLMDNASDTIELFELDADVEGFVVAVDKRDSSHEGFANVLLNGELVGILSTSNPNVLAGFADPSANQVIEIINNRAPLLNYNFIVTTGNQPPTADAGEPVAGTTGESVQFDGSASSDPEGGSLFYDWDFGDGSDTVKGEDPIVNHTYQESGQYIVTLWVTEVPGETKADLQDTAVTVAVIGTGSAPPVADTGGPYGARPGESITFDAGASEDDDGIAEYIWDFGDGTLPVSRILPTTDYTYAESGEYDVTLTVIDNDSNADQDFTKATIADGNQPPVANAGAPAIGSINTTVFFFGGDSTDPEGGPLTYEWDFGDNSPPSTEEAPGHIYTAANDYQVTLVVRDDQGVADSAFTSASIDSSFMAPVADAGGPYQGAPGVPIVFDGRGSTDDGEILNYSWDFDDDSFGDGPTAINVYDSPGTYQVRLRVDDDDGLSDTDTVEVLIAEGNLPPVADPGGPYPGTVDVAVFFDGSGSSDPEGGPLTYEWDFGDNTDGTGETTNHAYTAPDTYTVTLVVRDDQGVADSQETTVEIVEGNQPPTADAGEPVSGTTGLAVTFDGSGSSDPDGNIVSYDWNFGDGNVGTGETTDHTYVDANNYTVTLTVTDDDGDTSAEAFTTADIDSDNQSPVADANGPYPGKVNVPVEFDGSASADPDGKIVKYDWDFGDGNEILNGEPTETHAYTDTGPFDVVLTVWDDDGASAKAPTKAIIGDGVNLSPVADPGGPYRGDEGVLITFDGSGSSDPDGNIVQYDWSFGDGNVGTGETTSHTYADADIYTVTLTVTDDGDKANTETTVAAIGMGNQLPTADAGGPYPGAVNQPVRFDATGSDDADGVLVSAEWDFGDNSTGSGLNPDHTYTVPGPYTATLTVKDDEGGVDTDSAQVIVGDGLQLLPTADANGPYPGVAGAPVTFDGSNSSDPDGNIAAWDWVFGDGMTGNGPTLDHTYLASSLYNVILEVTDDDGLPASDGTLAFIGALSVPPTADANGPYQGSVGDDVTFDGTASDDPDGTIEQYDWDWGDDSPADLDAGPIAQHAYTDGGIYFVKLTVTDDTGETDTDVTIAQIGEGRLPPTADAGPATRGIAFTRTFDGTGSSDPDGNIVSYDWNFGDGNTGTGPSPTHVYDATGAYFVTLTVTDNEGNLDWDGTAAVIGFSSAPEEGCRDSGKQSVSLKSKKGKFNWKWKKGAATAKADFGNPLTVTDYQVCLFDSVANELAPAFCVVVPAGADWKEKKKGFLFKSKTGVEGITKIELKAGEAGKAKIKVKGKHMALPELPLSHDPNVVVQISNEAGVCWESRFATEKKNDAKKFKAK